MNRAREPHLRMPPAPEVAPTPVQQTPPQQPAPQQPVYPPQYTPQQRPYDHNQQWSGYPPQQPYNYYGPQQQQQMPYHQYPVTTQHVTPPMMQQNMQPSPPPPVYDNSLNDPEPHAPQPSSWRVMFAIVGLVAIAGLSWIAYCWGPSYDGPPPLIPAPEGPYKVKPESPGGAAIAYRDTLVYDRLAQHPHQSSGEQNVVILPDEPSMPASVPEGDPQPSQQSQMQGTPLAQMNQQAPVAPIQTPPAQAAAAPAKVEPNANQEMDSMLAKLSDIQEIPATNSQVYFLQMATLKSDAEAIMEMKRLKNKLHLQQSKWHVRKNENAAGDTQYVLLLGPYKTRDEAKKRCGTIKNGCSVVAAQ